MTDGTRILRTVGIPVVIAIILLVMLPKMCARAVQVSVARKEKEEPAVSGLHISSSLHTQSSEKPVTYPAGLDSERVRYLVEIDARFSAPSVVRLRKTPGIAATPVEQKIVPVLQKLGYVELGSDGTLTLTRDGVLHLDGLVDDGSSWTFPLAKRQFGAVTSLESDCSTAQAGFSWKWEPNPVGAELMAAPKEHGAKAELANVGGRWSLTQVTDLDSDLE